jgi:hypothetical protein
VIERYCVRSVSKVRSCRILSSEADAQVVGVAPQHATRDVVRAHHSGRILDMLSLLDDRFE